MENGIVLSMRNIGKSFPGVRALQHVDFTLRKGEIHALMGENGAGKSTLIKVLTGVYPKDEGEIYIDGTEGAITIRSPQEAQSYGISTVYQEITLCPNLTVAENMFIGRGKGMKVDWKDMERRSGALLSSLGIPARPRQQLGSCSLAVQQMVAIARAVDTDCKVLILDEPTSSLDDKEVEMLFRLMQDLKSRGVGIIFVTHFLEQVYQVSDRITVLRNGELVGEYEVEKLPQVELVAKMMGKELEDLNVIKKAAPDAGGKAVTYYEAEGLASTASRPFNFRIARGEVNGFTGLLGSGRSESVRAIFGADRVTGGKVKVDGKPVRITKPIEAMKNGIGYLPEDRKRDGIIADLSVRDNIILALQVMKGFFHPFSKAEAEKFADEYIRALEIKTASTDTPIKSLSGGNQQKVILARWLSRDVDVLILDEPTVGVDVGVKAELYVYMRRLADKGAIIIMVSSDLAELTEVSDRVLVLHGGTFFQEFRDHKATQQAVLLASSGVAAKEGEVL